MSDSVDGDGAASSGRAHLPRRDFLVGAGSTGAGAAAMALSGGTFVSGTGSVSLDPWLQTEDAPGPDPPENGGRYWLGPHYWGNRLQDWRRSDGRIVCLRGERSYEVRTVSVLTRELVRGDEPGHVRVVTGLQEDLGGGGFCGFLIGTGTEEADYRTTALVQRGSGVGGGTLCTFETDGRVRFRDHTAGDRPLAFDERPAETYVGEGGPRRPTVDAEIELALDILPRETDGFDVQLEARDAASGALLAGAIRRAVPEDELLGGIALVSSPYPNRQGARWWFERFRTAGPKLARHPERTFGPIAGTLYSVHDGVLKLTAQLLPVDTTGQRRVQFQYRPAGSDGPWRRGPRAQVEPGYIARFRIEDWPSDRVHEYRVVYEDASGRTWDYTGRIRRDPDDADELRIGLLSCTVASARMLEAGTPEPEVPQARPLGRFTPENIYFPHRPLARNVGAHDPDLLVFVGDQLYETSPTRVEDRTDPGLDYLYKWYLWLWSFRGLTRDRPTILLMDDHDVYQPNLWGEGGAKAPESEWADGGYIGRTEFVNRVQRIQCGHNPDPHDPTAAERDISAYYTAFRYGGVSFALLEDRKFKSAPPTTRDPDSDGGLIPDLDPDPDSPSPSLVGARQKQFLWEWGRRVRDDPATICLTQTAFACPQTTPAGDPNVDYDSNGYPPSERDRAIDLLRDAGALVLSGDQHLATLLRHGIDDYTDGVVQFSGPAGGAIYQRWFEPTDALPNGRAGPNTGDYTDAFGNKFRMLAVANPKISFAEYRRRQASGQTLGDRRLKREGYGLVRVDHEQRQYTIECWPWNVDPTEPDATQFSGWPYQLPFDATDGA